MNLLLVLRKLTKTEQALQEQASGLSLGHYIDNTDYFLFFAILL